MTLVRHQGTILRRSRFGGKIARSRKCCCDCGCSPEPAGNLKAIFRALTAECATFDGLEIILYKGAKGSWGSGEIPEFENIQGWTGVGIGVQCNRPNECNPSGPTPSCKDYTISGGQCQGVITCLKVASCTCSPFRIISEEIAVSGLSGACCEICTCDIFADNRFYWEIVEV